MIYGIMDDSGNCIKYFFREDKAEDYIEEHPDCDIFEADIKELLTDAYND